ncbi:hypothetical protein O3P69_017943 [Scylla paramamosain]|uniref:Uncharacterized protein n=1 Tax=Scylla paramamosain TaxID=85552 RepID=A0AAW0TGU0_SCYPA
MSKNHRRREWRECCSPPAPPTGNPRREQDQPENFRDFLAALCGQVCHACRKDILRRMTLKGSSVSERGRNTILSASANSSSSGRRTVSEDKQQQSSRAFHGTNGGLQWCPAKFLMDLPTAC